MLDDGDCPRCARLKNDLRRIFGCERNMRRVSVTEDRAISIGIGPEHVQKHEPVRIARALRRVRRHLGRAEVVEGAPIAAPRRRNERCPVDRVGEESSRGRLDDVKHFDFRPAFGEADAEPVVQRRRIKVDREVLSF